MPIVNGRYEAKLSTTFSTIEDGIEEIKRKTQKSRRIRISNIPMSLLKQLEPILGNKDLKIILPIGENPLKNWRNLERSQQRKQEYTLTSRTKKQTQDQLASPTKSSTSCG